MKCEICHRTAHADGVALFRVNPVGEIGIWRCEAHLTPEQLADVDPETLRLIRILQESYEP